MLVPIFYTHAHPSAGFAMIMMDNSVQFKLTKYFIHSNREKESKKKFLLIFCG